MLYWQRLPMLFNGRNRRQCRKTIKNNVDIRRSRMDRICSMRNENNEQAEEEQEEKEEENK
jgi:hypothetical protein